LLLLLITLDALALSRRGALIDNRPSSGYNSPSIMAVVTLYTKPGCHLCDEARDALLRVQKGQPFDLEEININAEGALLAEYGEQIPVVLLNGTFLTEYTVDEERLRQLLREIH
jgi:glutaredoxin